MNIIIIGAPRSGTNILRDTLSSLSNVGTWNCDEIPYIWMYGNKNYTTDLLTPDMVTPKISRFIRKQFDRISLKTESKNVLEKTCANSLRVDFIDKIFPDAKYIYIMRDGIDVTYSIMQRWNSKFDLPYTLKKIKYVPKLDIPYYGLEFLKNRFHKSKNKDRLKFWGPRFTNATELERLSLEEISAKQWVACVESSNNSFRKINSKRVYKLKYEDFVMNPANHILEIANFIGVSIDSSKSFPIVNSTSIGKGKKMFTDYQLELIKPIIIKSMYENNYSCD